MDNNCGIYKIENIKNNKVYIGSSNNIKERWKRHIKDLKNDNHHSFHLQKAWNKYGEENFKFEIIEKCKKEDLLDKEQYYMDLYNSYNKKYGYNISMSAKRALLPEEMLYKLGKQRRKLSEEQLCEILYYLTETDISLYKVAKIVGVNKSTVNQIYFKEAYKIDTININFIKRTNRGQKSKHATLTENQVLEIIELLQKNISCTKIAQLFNSDTRTINDIKNHKTWTYLTEAANFQTFFHKGNSHSRSILTEEQVKEIKLRLLNGESNAQLGREYGVSRHTIGKIKNNKNWKHIQIEDVS